MMSANSHSGGLRRPCILCILIICTVPMISSRLLNLTLEKYDQKCWMDFGDFICDPTNIFDPLSRQTLGSFLKTVPLGTPCFCHAPCPDNEDENFPTMHLAIGVVILSQQTSDQASVQTFAERLRSRWVPGACPGNDVLFMVSGKKVYLNYGVLVRRQLTPNCLPSLPTGYELNDDLSGSLSELATIVREYFVNPCICGPCQPGAGGDAALQSWLKIPTMLLACFCLLLWLVFIGRRAHLRRLSALANVQLTPRYRRSVFDLPPVDHRHSSGNDTLVFQPPCRPLHPSQGGLFSLSSHRTSGESGGRFMSGENQRLCRSDDPATETPLGDQSERSIIGTRWTPRSPSPPPSYLSIAKLPPYSCPGVLPKPPEDQQQSDRATPLTEPDHAQAPPAYADVVTSSITDELPPSTSPSTSPR